jgi:hypothetical protein
MAGHRIFLSYSSHDQSAANEICAGLERAGIGCWIASRDLSPGTQWGGGIVEALDAADAVLVVFSEAANESPQIAREMEIAVSRRKPLIPVRIADAMPTQDMQYFLGVSHWFNAFDGPLKKHLPQIVAATKAVLAREASPWQRIRTRVPTGRNAQIALAAAVVLLAAIIIAWAIRPAPGPSFAAAMHAPLGGRWQADLTVNGRKYACVFDVPGTLGGETVFTDDCPPPLGGTRGPLGAAEGLNSYAPTLFQQGDSGTFIYQGGGNSYVAAYKLSGDTLVTRDAQFGEVTWQKIDSGTPLHTPDEEILPQKGSWPLADVQGIARRALAYARQKWQSDAVIESIKFTLADSTGLTGGTIATPAGQVSVQFSLYSPATQKGLSLMPGSQAGSMFSMGTVDWGSTESLPPNFIDLPQAVDIARKLGMRAHDIKEATLGEEGDGPAQTKAGRGNSKVVWMIDSALGERFFISPFGL